MNGRNRGDYAAVLTPTGAHVIRYRRRRRLLEVEQYRGVTTVYESVEQAADGLADLLEAEGARDGRVALAIAGFGTYHHLLSLPPATPDLLEPILHREMRRFFPDLYEKGKPNPYLSSVAAGPPSPRSDSPMRDLLVAAIPRETVGELRTALGARGIRLDHLTVVPAAVVRLHESFVGDVQASAIALVLPRYSLAAFFYEGALKLFTEPPAGAREATADSSRLVADQVERGILYLRQQFRGARPQAIWMAAEPELAEQVEEALAGRTEAGVRELDPGEPPGSLVALGAALNSLDPTALDLLPAEFRPPSPTERWTRALGVATAAVLLLAMGWWALSGVRAEASAAQRMRAAQEAIVPRSTALARIQPIVDERQAHGIRSEILRTIVAEREKLPELLWPIQDFEPAVAIQAFQLTRSSDGWYGSISGTARSYTSADAAATVDAFFRELSLELPEGSLQLDDLAYGTGADPEQMPVGVAVSFRMSFIVPLEEWTLE